MRILYLGRVSGMLVNGTQFLRDEKIPELAATYSISAEEIRSFCYRF